MKPCFIDHIAITAPTLEAGAELVYQSLGITPQYGGEHPTMGTHNLLLRLGDEVYLEVIAADPNVENPLRPRWFGLDDLNPNTPAGLKTWAVRTDNIQSTVKTASESVGEIVPMARGDKNWLITIPQDGSIPVNGGAPALIQWQTDQHPAQLLKDYGFSLVKLQIYHPEPQRITGFLQSINFNGDVDVFSENDTKIIALIDTPHGIREL